MTKNNVARSFLIPTFVRFFDKVKSSLKMIPLSVGACSQQKKYAAQVGRSV